MTLRSRTVPFHQEDRRRPRKHSFGERHRHKGFASRWIRSEGRRLLLVSADLSADDANEGTPYQGEATVLAVFDLEQRSRLLDVMDIKTDRFTAFREDHPLVHLNSQNDAFVIYSTHSNAVRTTTILH